MRYLVDIGLFDDDEIEEKSVNKSINDKTLDVIRLSKTEVFNKVYEENKGLSRKVLRSKLCSQLRPFFRDKDETEYFVDDNLSRIRKNVNSKKNRAWKKARLADFNYFCTFTYDDNKVTESEFRTKLKRLLANLNYRKHWTYMGVWERGEKTNRLHFHALVHVPEGQMVGEFTKVRDYNTEKRRMQGRKNNVFERAVYVFSKRRNG